MTLIGLPNTLPPKSSTAICAAATDPGPSAADEGPFMSGRPPILTTSSETCARAAGDADNKASTAKLVVILTADIASPPFVTFSLGPSLDHPPGFSIISRRPWPKG